jgi:hypothetical protein
MVPQSPRDRNHIIADIPAFQQAVAIQRANVDHPVLESHVGAAQFAPYCQCWFAYVQHNLPRESPE